MQAELNKLRSENQNIQNKNEEIENMKKKFAAEVEILKKDLLYWKRQGETHNIF